MTQEQALILGFLSDLCDLCGEKCLRSDLYPLDAFRLPRLGVNIDDRRVID